MLPCCDHPCKFAGLHIDSKRCRQTFRGRRDSTNGEPTSWQSTGQPRIGNRRKVSVPARLTWRDASGTLRFVSVVMREVSDVDAFVECQVPASIPLYRLVHFQVERPVRDGELPAALQEGKVLSAVYRVGPHKTRPGRRWAMRSVCWSSRRPISSPQRTGWRSRTKQQRRRHVEAGLQTCLDHRALLSPVACQPAEQVLVGGSDDVGRHLRLRSSALGAGAGALSANARALSSSASRFLQKRQRNRRRCAADSPAAPRGAGEPRHRAEMRQHHRRR